MGSPADDGTDQARALVALAERFVDPPAALYALRCLVGVACRHTGETPRSILEAEFVNAPSDEVWRATVGRRV